MTEHDRCWLAQICYPKKKPVWFGHVMVRIGATHQEVEEAVTTKVLEHLPPGFDIIRLEPGILIMTFENQDTK